MVNVAKRDRKHMLLVAMGALKQAVDTMSSLYDAHPELNDEYELSHLFPMSLDEWAAELTQALEDIGNKEI